MIIARAPLRISFCGGGTDLPCFYEKHGPGAVVSTSINRYVYVTVSEKFDGKVSVRYRNHEMVDTVDKIEHPLIREILKKYGITSGVEIVIISEVPARGSGLGASSALAVALCAAMERFVGVKSDLNDKAQKSRLAEEAAFVEINMVGSPIGKQDHYASAVGGFNLFTFFGNGNVLIDCYNEKCQEFISMIESHSVLYYLNAGHEYKGSGFVQKILRDQVDNMEDKIGVYKAQRDNAVILSDHIAYEQIERFMDHVNENWRIKKLTHPDISNKEIDSFMERAMAAGAVAGKMCGAGGGGFAYLIVPEAMREDVAIEFNGEYESLSFGFDRDGVKIIYDDGRRINDRLTIRVG